MTYSIQTLGVVDRLFPDIIRGEKKSTIRWREQHIVPGPLEFVNDGDPGKTIMVLVTRCAIMPLSEAAAFVGKSDEWSDAVMLSGMQKHYPDIALIDDVQVIEFELPV